MRDQSSTASARHQHHHGSSIHAAPRRLRHQGRWCIAFLLDNHPRQLLPHSKRCRVLALLHPPCPKCVRREWPCVMQWHEHVMAFVVFIAHVSWIDSILIDSIDRITISCVRPDDAWHNTRFHPQSLHIEIGMQQRVHTRFRKVICHQFEPTRTRQDADRRCLSLHPG